MTGSYFSSLCLYAALALAGAHAAAGLVGLRTRAFARVRPLSTGLVFVGLAAGGCGLVSMLSAPPAHALGFGLDRLSAALTMMVVVVGGAVLSFSKNYLAGDPRQSVFFGGLHLTLAAVILFVLAADLWTFALAWGLMSLSVHRLLLFYPERPGARRAADKKFWLARAGDLALLAAFVLLYRAAGTSDIAAVAHRAAAAAASAPVTAAALLLTLAAVLKSAQFPAHGWLIEVMETPTPVSALLHAGVVNAGGVLMLRFAGLMALEDTARWLLAAVALGSVAVATLAMTTQTNVKAGLAWSTVAQMGFMLLQCALGAFGAALFHILAHAVYKADAFLAAGAVPSRPRPVQAPRWPWVGLGVAAVFTGLGAVTGRLPADALVLGLAGMGLTTQLAPARPLVWASVAAAAIGLATLGHGLGNALLGAPTAPVDPALALFAVTGMGLLCALQLRARTAPRQRRLSALYVHVKNGFYINALLNRMQQS